MKKKNKCKYDKKTCNTCGESKPLDEFYKNGKYYNSSCKSCELDKRKEEYKNNPEKREKVKIAAKEFLKRNPDYQKIWKEENLTEEKKREYSERALIARNLKYENNPELLKEHSDRIKTRKKDNPELYLLAGCRQRARKKNLDFDLTIDDIVIPKLCPVFGIELEVLAGWNSINSASVDRIDNSKGYIKGNVQVISRLANTMKNSASLAQLIMFAEWVIKEYSNFK